MHGIIELLFSISKSTVLMFVRDQHLMFHRFFVVIPKCIIYFLFLQKPAAYLNKTKKTDFFLLTNCNVQTK